MNGGKWTYGFTYIVNVLIHICYTYILTRIKTASDRWKTPLRAIVGHAECADEKILHTMKSTGLTSFTEYGPMTCILYVVVVHVLTSGNNLGENAKFTNREWHTKQNTNICKMWFAKEVYFKCVACVVVQYRHIE